MTRPIRYLTPALVMLGLLGPAAAGRATPTSPSPARRCPVAQVPGRPGDASTTVDLDQDGRADLLVLNLDVAPNIRVALADGRQMYATYAAPSDSFGIEVAVPFPGVFALSSSSPLSRFSSSQRQDYFIINRRNAAEDGR